MVSSDGKSREISLERLPATLGRGDECKVRIPVASVSRKHCELSVDDDDELVIKDLKSSNGTYVNGERVRSRELVPGDLVAVGPVVFVVRIDGHPKDVDPLESYAAGAVDAATGPSAGAPGGPAAIAGVPTWSAQAGAAKGDDRPTQINERK